MVASFVPLPDWMTWVSDACNDCLDHEGCFAVLPVAVLENTRRELTLSYRCRHGHDWLCSWSPMFAKSHAMATQLVATEQRASVWPW